MKSIKTKILTPVIIMVFLVAVAILISNIVLFSNFVDSSTLDKLGSATKVAANGLESLKAEAKSASLSIAKDSAIVNALKANDSDTLLARARALQIEANVEFCTITDPYGNVIVRTHAPDTVGDSISDQVNIQSAMHGETFTTIEEGTVVLLSVRTGSPVIDENGTLLGIISAGYRLDTARFVDSIKEMIGCEVTVVLGDERISTTVVQEDGTRAVGTRADAHIAETVLGGNTYSGNIEILGRKVTANYIPVNGPDGKPIGMMFIGLYADEASSTIQAFVQGGLLIMLLMIGAFIIIILLLTGRIVAPLQAMTQSASALAYGDTDINVEVKTHDETRSLADAFNTIIATTRKQIQIIEKIADGDPTVSVTVRSEKDFMNQALEKLDAKIKEQADALRGEYGRIRIMLDANPLASRLWNRDYQLLECNEAAVKLFRLKSKQEYIERYFDLLPEYQPDGMLTSEKSKEMITEAFDSGICHVDVFMYQTTDGLPLPVDLTLVRVPYGGDYVVAGYSRDLREQMKMISEIKERDYLLQTTNNAADTLLRSKPNIFANVLLRCMENMANSIGADRMYIFKNYTENESLCCTQLYEWSENVNPYQNTEFTKNIIYDKSMPFSKESLSRGECVHALVREMPAFEKKLFESQGILAILLVPVFIHNEFWGFVGFDNCHDERLFSENEETVMRSGSLLIANALLRNEYVTSIQNTAEELETALDEAKNANNAKGEFLASISHEMRTPLNAVIGLSEITLDNESLDTEAKSNLEKIYSSGSTLLSIVNDILDISKIQSGKFAIIPHRYDVPSLINDSILQNVLRIGSRPIRFILDLKPNTPANLFGDELRIKQIINNLLSNAIKYTEKGTVQFGVSCEREGNSVWMTLTVSDTGIGIKEEHVETLFADFVQFGSTSYHQAGGTGLGLAITKRLAELMSGTISVDSKYGEGSTFSVKLLQGYAGDAVMDEKIIESLKKFQYSANKLKRNSHSNRVPLSYARVLLVDDNITNLDVAKGLMKPYEMQIDCVTSGLEAVRAVSEEKVIYNAIFMDHMMPVMDGIEAVRIIREEIGTDYARSVPIIALTANAVTGNEDMFLNSGFQAFISKPIDVVKLDTVLRQWVRNKALEDDVSTGGGTGFENDDSAVSHSKLENITISGVDLPSALERFNSDEDVLIDILRSFTKNTRSLMDNLRKYLDEENLDDYAIAIHGIKGSCFGIFANDAGKEAEALERYSKNKDYEAVKQGHSDFEKTASRLLGEIDDALDEIDGENNTNTDDETGSPFGYFDFTAPDALVLIVDDNEINLKVAAGLLRPFKMRIETARNGKEALKMIQEKRYNIIFMDHMMPVMDGIEATVRLRRMEGEYFKTVPVIALSANDDSDLKEIFIQAGMTDCATKPIDMLDISKKLRRLLPVEVIIDAAETQNNTHKTSENNTEDENEELSKTKAPEKAQSSGEIPKIEGINPDDGIRNSGSKEIFISLLKDFYNLIDLKSERLEKTLADGLYREAANEAHSLKTSSRTIGALILSEKFAMLESWGNEGNVERLTEEAPEVLKLYRSYKQALQSFISGGARKKEKKDVSEEIIINYLNDLINAMDSFNIDGADNAIKALEELTIPDECAEKVELLRAYVADVAADEAVRLAEDIITTIKEVLNNEERTNNH
ncbi:MAG: response regulator [Clostridiales bacterium]|nr:response regulator [Clostridiales bacterium]